MKIDNSMTDFQIFTKIIPYMKPASGILEEEISLIEVFPPKKQKREQYLH